MARQNVIQIKSLDQELYATFMLSQGFAPGISRAISYGVENPQTKDHLFSSYDDRCVPPFFQEIHQQNEGVFLSGSSDSGYLSLAVKALETGFRFDYACRINKAGNLRRFGDVFEGKGLRVESPFGGSAAASILYADDRIIVTPGGDCSQPPPCTIQFCVDIIAANKL